VALYLARRLLLQLSFEIVPAAVGDIIVSDKLDSLATFTSSTTWYKSTDLLRSRHNLKFVDLTTTISCKESNATIAATIRSLESNTSSQNRYDSYLESLLGRSKSAL
jgi:hypothetical protein